MKDESFRPNRMLSYFSGRMENSRFLLRFPVSSIIWDFLQAPGLREK